MTIALNDQDEAKLRRLAKERFNGRKGSMAKTVSEGLKKLDAEDERELARQRFIERMKKGFNLGIKKMPSRDELYDRWKPK